LCPRLGQRTEKIVARGVLFHDDLAEALLAGLEHLPLVLRPLQSLCRGRTEKRNRNTPHEHGCRKARAKLQSVVHPHRSRPSQTDYPLPPGTRSAKPPHTKSSCTRRSTASRIGRACAQA